MWGWSEDSASAEATPKITSGARPPQTTGRVVRTSKPETGPLAQMLGAAAGR